MRIVLYETKIKRVVISMQDTDNIEQFIKETYEYETEDIALERRNLYRVALSSNYLYRRQLPCCWKLSKDNEHKELIVGNVMFVRKSRGKYKGLTDKDIQYITQRYRPYNYDAV